MNSIQYPAWAIKTKKWLPHPLTVLSGAVIVLAFPPWDFWPLIWIALVPWFFALRKAHSIQRSIVEGFWLNFLMTLGGFSWIAYSVKEFGGVIWPVAFLGLILFCFVGQPQFLIFPLVLKKTRVPNFLKQDEPGAHPRSRRKKIARAALGALTLLWLSFLYTGIDWIVPKMFQDTLGHALYQATYLRQAADLGGAQVLTLLIFLVNLSLFEFLKTSKKTRRVSFSFPLVFAGLVFLGFYIYGSTRQEQILGSIQSARTQIQVAAIQGNIGDFEKVAAENDVATAALRIIDTFTFMTDQALSLSPRPEVIIWPETSYPSLFRQPSTSIEFIINDRVENYVKAHGVPLLFGGYDRKDHKEFNSFFFLQPTGELEIYHKSKLLLFGEYIPGAESIDYIKETFPQVGNFGNGPGPEVFDLKTRERQKTTKVAPIICYEALFPTFLIESARKGSQLILNITNDSWFGTWGEPQLHLALTIFRSIETRLPMVRSTNTGITTLITAEGEITHPTKIGTQEILNVTVPITPPIWTLIKEWGDWFGSFALVLGLFGLTLREILRKKPSLTGVHKLTTKHTQRV